MKIIYISLIFVLMGIFVISCSDKEETTPVSNDISFQKLAVSDTVMPVNGITTITATATGEGLTYTWLAEYGTFIGSGNTVQWTVCHADRFKITCEVTDQGNHKVTKDVYIRTYEP